MNAQPHDETPIPGGEDIRYVLEINGGLSRTLGIEPGAVIRSPALDQSAPPGPARLSLSASAAAATAVERSASGRGAAW